MRLLLLLLVPLLLPGCDATRQLFVGPGSRTLVQMVGPTRNPDEQFCNLANNGLLLNHDLNTGYVQVSRRMWGRLSTREQQAAARIIQNYQNRNSPRPVIIYAVAS